MESYHFQTQDQATRYTSRESAQLLVTALRVPHHEYDSPTVPLVGYIGAEHDDDSFYVNNSVINICAC